LFVGGVNIDSKFECEVEVIDEEEKSPGTPSETGGLSRTASSKTGKYVAPVAPSYNFDERLRDA
jgi:hypothetical protein